MGHSATDGELVEASRRGELAAFGHLVERYQDVVCAVSYSSTGDRVLGEDVAQETFLAAWRQLDRVRDASRFRPWLCGIARNLGRKARRKLRREAPIDDDAHAAPDASPFDHASRADAERVVRDALERIPETYREVLVLYYREDRSIREVAEALGISEPAVMQRLSRGRRYLADGVTALVEKSLRDARPRRDLVAAVLAAIAAFALPSRVDASPANAKGSTMMKKLVITASALVAVGATVYFVHDRATPAATAATTARPTLHYGAGLPRAQPIAPVASPRAAVARATAVDDLQYLPADADVVFGIDVARLRGSALWKQFVAPALAGASGLREFSDKCGFDPLASLASVSIGAKGRGDDRSVTLVVHGFDKSRAMACFDKLRASEAENSFGVVVDGDVVTMVGKIDGEKVGFTFVDETTALVVFGKDATKDGIAKVAAGNPQASPLADLLQVTNMDDPVWLVVGEGSPVLASINDELAAETSIRMHAVWGSIDVTDRIVVMGGARLGAPDLVAKLVAEAKKQLDELAAAGELAQYVDQLDVDADHSDVLVAVSVNAGQLMHLVTSGTLKVSVE
jgi:RNA polymerase sigma factor (sigma-70 family)